MILFKKKKNRNPETDEGEKTPVKFSRAEKLKKGEKKLNKKKWTKKYTIILLSIVIFLLLGFFGFKLYNSARHIFEGDGTGILNLLSGNTTQPLKGERDGRVNVLLLGIGDEGHSGSTLSDTMIIASYDTKSKSVAMFSIPRDLYVKIPSNGYAKINAAHAYGEQKSEGTGPSTAEETIEGTFDITIHYYARVDFSGLSELVDALGGVTVEVERNFCDYNYPNERKGDTRTVCFKKGPQLMNGIKALQFSRSRHAYGPEGSDFARSKRQQKVLIAIKEKSLSAGTALNPKKIIDIMSALGKHVKTDFSLSEIPRLIELATEIDTSKIISKNFDNSPTGFLISGSSTAAGYILKPKTGNFKEIQSFIKNIFAEESAKLEKAKIAIFNGTWTTSLAISTGKEMKDAGYVIIQTGDMPTRNYTKTQIIDYTDGKKPDTIKALENKFDVKAIKQESASDLYEIKVIIGKDFLY